LFGSQVKQEGLALGLMALKPPIDRMENSQVDLTRKDYKEGLN